jgi:sugar lactone lactonase YvrE
VAAEAGLREVGSVTSEAVASTINQALLGEGLRWDERRDELLAVDIIDGRVYRARVVEGGALSLVREYWVPGTVGAVAPVSGDDGWMLAAGRGFVHLAPDGSLRPVAQVAPFGSRMNDGACDPQGRFWAGALALDFRPGAGSLYRLERDGNVEVVLEGLTISNGMDWSPDGTVMYLADSGPREVHAFAFDGETGSISDDHLLITVDEDVGVPDGLTVAADGDLWLAIYGGGRVHRYSPDGVLRQVLQVPAEQCTSCAFAGPGLDRLYVTTATEGWSDEQRRADPSAGIVYRFDVSATGRPAAPFRPGSTWWREVTSDS